MGKLPRGLPRSYIKKWGISKLAWRKFRAGALTKGIRTRTKAIKKRIRGATRRTRRSNPGRKRGGRTRMVRTYRRRRRGGGGKSMTRTAFKLIRLGSLVGGGLAETVNYDKPLDKIAGGLLAYGGFSHRNKAFFADLFVRTWTPYVMACLATYGIPKLVNIIRRL